MSLDGHIVDRTKRVLELNASDLVAGWIGVQLEKRSKLKVVNTAHRTRRPRVASLSCCERTNCFCEVALVKRDMTPIHQVLVR